MSDRPITTKLTEAQRRGLEESDALLFDPEEYDDAIVGVSLRDGKTIAAYDHDRLCEITIALGGSDPMGETAWSGAAEHVSFNMIRGAGYAGIRAPVVVSEVREPPDEEEEVLSIDGKEWVVL